MVNKLFKAATWNFHFLTIMAAPVDKSGVSPSISHNNDLDMLERYLF